MTDIDRRGFVKAVAAVVPAAALIRPTASDTRKSIALPLDDELLRALGEAVLPTELDAVALTRVIGDFQTWLEAYEPNAELNHGYGTGEIRHTPNDPAPRWESQLGALESEAQRTLGRPFAVADVEARREMVRAQLANDDTSRLPRPHTASHVAVGLLAYYYATPEASDLCYRRAIGKNSCRPLARSPEEPAPLPGRGDRDA